MTVARRKKGWSYSTGERGRNRVRVYERPKSGQIFLELSDRGKRKRIAPGHRDREAAKAKAEEVAAELRRAEFTPHVDSNRTGPPAPQAGVLSGMTAF